VTAVKRLINYSSLLAVAALAWVLVTAFDSAPIEARGVFAAFAPGARTPVRFSAEDLSSLDGTALERRNQLRDWLLYTVVSDAGLDDEALSSVLYDLPPLRSGYTEPVSRFEYGRTRSRTIGAGEVIALVPRALPTSPIANTRPAASVRRPCTSSSTTWRTAMTKPGSRVYRT
jgi:hypothetical protein